jgi:predicted Zn-dependent protease
MKNALARYGVIALCLLTGCGSGSLPGASEQPTYALAAPFQPRYTSQLASRGRWATRTVRVAVGQGAEKRPLADLRPAMEREIGRWTAATSGLVAFSFVDEPADAEVHVTFVEATDPDLPASRGEQAVTQLQWNEDTPRDALSSAQIKIRVGLTMRQVATIAAHEMGHALGITGHSDDPKDLMAPQFNAGTPVSPRDAGTLAFLYLSNDRD